MAKSIITQNGALVNYSNLLAVYVDEDIDDDDRVLGYDLIGVASAEKNAQAIILGSFKNEKSAENAKADIIRWLRSEAFSTFDMPVSDEVGDA